MSQQFDWYQLSTLNPSNPDVDKFESIVRSSNIEATLDRVPTTYRKKLLQMFQTLSFTMKKQTQTTNYTNESLESKKYQVLDQIQTTEAELSESKRDLNRTKATIAEKKRLSKKLKEKIETLKKQTAQTKYFCPLCERQDFNSKEAFTFHMFSQHQNNLNSNSNAQSQSIPNDSLAMSHNDLKEFIMTLKDKEMEMMRMILSQKKMMDTQDLERAYEKEVSAHLHRNTSYPDYLQKGPNGYGQNYAANDEDCEDADGEEQVAELKGNSQFLFFQKSAQYRQAVERGEEQYSIRKAYEQQKQSDPGHPYYEFFTRIEENRSETIEEKRKPSHGFQQNAKDPTAAGSINGEGILQRFSLRTEQEMMEQRNYQSEHPVYVQPLKMNSNGQLHAEQYRSSASITDRLPEGESTQPYSRSKAQSKQMSFYRQSHYRNQQHSGTPHSKSMSHQTNKSASQRVIAGVGDDDVYVFNSGPLIIDRGSGDSDYEDYFGEELNNNYTGTQTHSQQRRHKVGQSHPQKHDDQIVEDEEIKMNPGSYSFVSRSSQQQISELISPQKEEPSRRAHEKSSEIVDLSEDSFSRRDFELSKDEQQDESTINLSELRLSKLERKKQEEKASRRQHPDKEHQFQETDSHLNQEEESKRSMFSKDKPNFILVSEEKPPIGGISNKEKPHEEDRKIIALSEFERKIQPLKPNGTYNNNLKQQLYQPYYHRGVDNGERRDLSEFYKKSLPHSYVSSQEQGFDSNLNSSQNEAQKATSPQDYFAKEMLVREKSRNESLVSPEESSRNQQSSQGSHNVDFSEFNRTDHNPVGKKSRQNKSQKGIRSSSSRKKLSRHEDLEDSSKGGILNEFLRVQHQINSHSQQLTSPENQNVLQEFIQ